MINYRKRKEEETDNKLKYANQDLILEILPVLDNFERAIKLDDNILTDELSKFLAGFKMMYASLCEVLKKFGVDEIECVGKEFDANTMQALMVDNDPNFEDDVVLEVLLKGYKLKDTFILMCSAQFFNAITPFSSGGQPFQMYLLKKQGIKVTDSGNALLQNFFTYQLALIIMGTFAVITNSFLHIIPSTSLLKNIVLIGYIVNIIVLVLLFSLGRAKNLNTKVFNKIFNFIFGFKFIKNREHLKEEATKKIDEFYNSSIYFKRTKL